MLHHNRILPNTAIRLSQYFKALRLCEEFGLKSLISDLSSETLHNYRNGAITEVIYIMKNDIQCIYQEQLITAG
jgi:hypothetical protein